MRCLDKTAKEAQVLRWALANRNCRIVDVPHWVIMILMEDVVYSECNLIEHLVMALDNSQGPVMQDGYLEQTAEKLVINVLLASLYEDGYIEVSGGLLDEPRLFDFHHKLDIQISLTSSGEEAHIWEELDLLESRCGAALH